MVSHIDSLYTLNQLMKAATWKTQTFEVKLKSVGKTCMAPNEATDKITMHGEWKMHSCPRNLMHRFPRTNPGIPAIG